MSTTTNAWETMQEAARLIGEERVPLDVCEQIVSDYGVKTPIEMEAYLEKHAGLLHQVGLIMLDRRENDDEAPLIWEWLYEHQSEVYDDFGKIIDDIEEACFG